MIYLGDNELLGVKLGNDDIAGIYVGDNLIYPTTVTAWSVTPTSFEVASGGSTEKIKIAALDSWTITSNRPWITFSQNSGDSGRTNVIATVAQNNMGDRTATITVSGDDGYVETISVEQVAAPYDQQYLTFEILSSGTINWKSVDSTKTIEYSKDGGTTWSAITSSSGDGIVINVVDGDIVMFKGDNTRYATNDSHYSFFGGSAKFNAYGNIMSLINSTSFGGQTTLSSAYTFLSLFQNCTGLVDASNLSLPATSLSNSCYWFMFRGCSNLTQGPILPATTLALGCYSSMFAGCTSLTSAPELPAETLAANCYSYMFYNCSSLNYIKCLATDISASNCTNTWTYNVASAGTFVKAASMTGWTTGDNGIPTNWTVQDDILPYDQQYLTFDIISGGTIVWYEKGTFYFTIDRTISYSINDSEWITISAVTQGTAFNVSSGDQVKFKSNRGYCSETDNAYMGFSSASTAIFNIQGNIMSLVYGDNFSGQTDGITRCGFQSLFQHTNVISAENLVLPATSLPSYCYAFMFYGCTGLTSAPELPATTLATNCYQRMFYNCTSLTTAPELPATTLATNCYQGMFYCCTSLTTAPELPATTLEGGCYSNMFYGCTGLTSAPELPAITLKGDCYLLMFNGCSSLNYIKCLATDISATNSHSYWVGGVASTGTFVKAASMTGWTTGGSGIPTGWTVQDAS